MDLWGRLVPGLTIVVELAILGFDPFGLQRVVALDAGTKLESVGLGLLVSISLAGLAGCLLGEVPVTLTLWLRDRWFNKDQNKIRRRLEAEDPTERKELSGYYTKHLNGMLPPGAPRSTFHFCKHSLIIRAPEAFQILGKIEARINLLAGMVIPLLGGAALAFACGPNWAFKIIVALALLAIAGFFSIGVLGWSQKEILVAEQAYYSMIVKSRAEDL